MPMTRIIATLRALAKLLWHSAKTSMSQSSTSTIREWPKTKSSFSESLALVRHDDGSESSQSPASNIPCGTLHHHDGTSDQHTVGELVSDDQLPTESIDASVHNWLGPVPSDSESSLSGSGKNGQPPLILAVDEMEESDTSLPLPSENRQCSLLKINKHPVPYEPNRITGCTKSTSVLQATLRKPRKITGRRDRRSQRPSSELRQSPASRPELVCRKHPTSGMWEVVLSADDECKLAAVHLDGEYLGFANNVCRIPSLTGSLVVSCQNGLEHNYSLFDGKPLIFKLRKNWAGVGHKTSGITRGHFIVIVPVAWEWTGHVPVEPAYCTDTDFRGHYFYRDAKTLNEDADGFQECDVFPINTGIELTGLRLFDDSEKGALFVGTAPNLKPSKSIMWGRVGEEAKNGWTGENFEPQKQSLSEILDGREGHFFLRAYDSEAKLLDSEEFRYLHNLRQIRVNGKQYTQDTVLVPQPIGYPPTEVHFVCAEGTTILTTMLSICIQETVHPCVFDVPPHPEADCISCTLGSNGSSVNILLNLPRIWWRMKDDRSDPGKWRDTPLVMTRHEFQEHANSNAMLLLMSKRCVSVCAGFDDELDREHRRTTEEDRIEIPLAHFVDYVQISQRLNDDTHFNVEWAGEILPLILISADPMPEIVSISAEPETIFAGQETILRWATRNADQARIVIDPDIGIVGSDGTRSVRPTETTNYALTLVVSGTNDVKMTVTVMVDSLPNPNKRLAARVRSTGQKWRNGKGFSATEIQEAGLAVPEAVGRSIPIDRRRRSSHLVNVEAIRRMLDA